MGLYLLFRLAGVIAPAVPRRLGYAVMGWLSRLVYRQSAASRRMIEANVHHALGPAADPAEVDGIVQRIFHNLLKNYFDLFWLPGQKTEQFARIVTVPGYDNILGALAMGKGAIVLSAHLGNQEVMAHARAFTDVPLTTVVEHVKNERVFNYLTSLREKGSMRLIPEDGALRELLRALRRNEIIGLAFDRDVTDSGRVVPFFGSPAKLPDGYAILALKHGIPVLPTVVVRQGDAYVAHIEKPMLFAGNAANDGDVRRVMGEVGVFFEKLVRTYIDQWVYFHYVWEDDKERLKNEQRAGQGSS